MLGRISHLTWRFPKSVLAVVVGLALVGGFFARDVEEHLKAAGFTDPDSESERGEALLQKALGYDPNPGIVAVLRDPAGGRLDLEEPAVRAEIGRVTEALAGAEHVGYVSGPYDGGPQARTLVAADGGSALVTAHLSTQDVEDAGGVAAEDARERIGESSLDVSLGGYAPSFNEVNDQTRKDLTNAELIAFPVLTVLLLLVFRGVIAAAIPLLIGVLAVAGSLAVLRVTAGIVDTSLFALNIATALSLGLAVDYALLMVSRYREELERAGPTFEAHERTVMTAGRAAAFSGLTVAISLVALVVMPQRFLYSLGVAGAAVGILSAVLALLVVPSVLRLAGDRINSLSIRRGPAVSDTSGGWYRLAKRVMRRPVAAAVGSAALLLAASTPLLFANLTGPSAEVVPVGLPSYEANAYLEEHYPRGVSEAATVAVAGDPNSAELAEISTRADAIDGVGSVGTFEEAGPELAWANVSLEDPALAGRSQDAVRELRSLEAGGAEVLVSGNTAGFLDQKSSLIGHAPLVVALVVGAMFAVLFFLTGSVLLPIKTLLMNALTLAASMGVVVLAFQAGILSWPLDYEGPGAIEVISMAFVFAVIFGLATDYAVLVLARIKESWDSGASNEEAVALGISKTGRVITAAALMIAVVFLAFAVSPVFFMKQIALAMAAGVLIDATIVRALLVPALMRLFGEWNWWAPAPLQRLHARWAAAARH